MYVIIKNCKHLKVIEMNSRLAGELKIDGCVMKNLESLTCMGIGDTVACFRNLINFAKMSPNLKKLDFWIRGNSAANYNYLHSEEISGWEIEDLASIDELKIWRYHKSEYGVLSFLTRSCRNVTKVEFIKCLIKFILSQFI